MMGLSRYSPNAAVREIVGASLVIIRVMTTRFIFIKSIQDSGNGLVQRILEDIRKRKSKWNRILKGYIKWTVISYEEILIWLRDKII